MERTNNYIEMCPRFYPKKQQYKSKWLVEKIGDERRKDIQFKGFQLTSCRPFSAAPSLSWSCKNAANSTGK